MIAPRKRIFSLIWARKVERMECFKIQTVAECEILINCQLTLKIGKSVATGEYAVATNKIQENVKIADNVATY